MTVFSVLVVAAAAMLAVATVLALVRIERGPSMLDRTVALDILTSVLVAAFALEVAASRRVEAVPILVALALVGFIASVTVARFAAVEPEGEGRVLSREEVAAMESRRIDEEEALERDSDDEEHHGGAARGEVKE